MAGDDNLFTLDPRGFTSAVKKISAGMAGMTAGAANMAKNISTGVINAVKKLGLVTLAFKGIQGAINQMPEVGKAFELTRGIITKNLLFPLRKAVVPMLQSMLDWVRDNRALFVKWGQTLANVFGVVVDKIENLISFGQRMGEVFAGFVEKTFGLQIKSFQDVINVLTFKVAVLFQFFESLGAAVFPLFVKIGEVFGKTIVGSFQTLSSLVKGFVEGLGNGIVPAAHDFLKVIDSVLTNLFTVNQEGQNIQTLFGEIGRIVGEVIVGAFESVASFAKGFARGTEGIVGSLHDAASVMNEIVGILFTANEDGASLQTIFETIGEILGQGFKGGIETVTAFVRGFVQGMDNVLTSVQGIASSISEIADSLFTANDEGNSLQTVFGKIGEIFGSIVHFISDATANLVGGFVPAISDIMTPLQRIVDAFGLIFETLVGGEEQLEIWGKAAKILGEIFGVTLMTVIKGVALVITGITESIIAVINDVTNAIEVIKQGIASVVSWIEKAAESIKGIFSEIGKITGSVGSGIVNIVQGAGQVAGNIGTGVSQFAGDAAAGAGQVAGNIGASVSQFAGDAAAGAGQVAGNIGASVSQFAGDITDSFGNIVGDIGSGLGGFLKVGQPVNDAIITNRGDVIPVHADDNIMAFKQSGPLVQNAPAITPQMGVESQREPQARGGVTVKLDIRDITVHLQNGSREEARQAGNILGESLLERFRADINMELTKAGI
jgi:phage-related protein